MTVVRYGIGAFVAVGIIGSLIDGVAKHGWRRLPGTILSGILLIVGGLLVFVAGLYVIATLGFDTSDYPL